MTALVPLARGGWFLHSITFEGETTDVADALAVFEICNSGRLTDKAVCRNHTGMVSVSYTAPNGPHIALAIALSQYLYTQSITLIFHSPAATGIQGEVTLLNGHALRAELERGGLRQIWSSEDRVLRTYSTVQATSLDSEGRLIEAIPLRSCVGLVDGFSTLLFPTSNASTPSSPPISDPSEMAVLQLNTRERHQGMSRRGAKPCRIVGGSAQVCLRVRDMVDGQSPNIVLRSPLRVADVNNALAIAEQIAGRTGTSVFICAAQEGCTWSSATIPSRAIIKVEPKVLDFADAYMVAVKPLGYEPTFYGDRATSDLRFSFDDLTEWAAEFIHSHMVAREGDSLPAPEDAKTPEAPF